jgi:prepilin-type N-terminal cleavage/methylation domain-containing protein
MSIQKNKTKGFTILELIVVLGILVVIAGFGTPALLDGIRNYSLKSEASSIYFSFQQMRLEAINNNADAYIVFNPQPYTAEGGVGSYSTFLDNGPAPDAGNGVQDASEPTIKNVQMSNTVSLYNCTFGGNSTSFDGRGLPGNIGSVELRNEHRWYKITLGISGNLHLYISKDGIVWN